MNEDYNFSLDLTGGNHIDTTLFRYIDALHDFSDKSKLGKLAYEVLKEQHQINGDFIRDVNNSRSQYSSDSSPGTLHSLIRNESSEQNYQVSLGNQALTEGTSPLIIGPIKIEALNNPESLPQLPPTGNFILKLIGPKNDLYQSFNQINAYLGNTSPNFTFTSFDGYYAKDAVALNDRFIEDLAGQKGKYLLAGLIDPASGSTEQITNRPFNYEIFYTNNYDQERGKEPVYAKITSVANKNNEYAINFYTNPSQKDRDPVIVNTGAKHSSPSIENISKFVNERFSPKQKNKTCVNFFSSFINRQTLKVKKILGGGKDRGFFKMTKEELANVRNIDWSPLFGNLLINYARAIGQDMNTITPFQAINCLISLKTNGDQSYYYDALCFKNARTRPSAVFSNDQFLIDYILYKKDVGIFNKTKLGSNLVVQIFIPQVNLEELEELNQQTEDQNENIMAEVVKIKGEFDNSLGEFYNNFGNNPYKNLLFDIEYTPEGRNNARYYIKQFNIEISAANITLFYYSCFQQLNNFLFYFKQIENFNTNHQNILSINNENETSVSKKPIPDVYLQNLKYIRDIFTTFNDETRNLYAMLINPEDLTDIIIKYIKHQFDEIPDDIRMINLDGYKKITIFKAAESIIANNTLYKKKGLNKYFVPADRFFLKYDLIKKLYIKFENDEFPSFAIPEVDMENQIPIQGEQLPEEAMDASQIGEATENQDQSVGAQNPEVLENLIPIKGEQLLEGTSSDQHNEDRLMDTGSSLQEVNPPMSETERMRQARLKKFGIITSDQQTIGTTRQSEEPPEQVLKKPRFENSEFNPENFKGGNPISDEDRKLYKLIKDNTDEILNLYLYAAETFFKSSNYTGINNRVYPVETLEARGDATYVKGEWPTHPIDQLFEPIYEIVDNYNFINQVIENTQDEIVIDLYECLNNEMLEVIYVQYNEWFSYIYQKDDLIIIPQPQPSEQSFFSQVVGPAFPGNNRTNIVGEDSQLSATGQNNYGNTDAAIVSLAHTDPEDTMLSYSPNPYWNVRDEENLDGGGRTKKRQNKPKSMRKNKNKNRKTKRVRNIKTKKNKDMKEKKQKKIIRLTPKQKLKSFKKLKTKKRKN